MPDYEAVLWVPVLVKVVAIRAERLEAALKLAEERIQTPAALHALERKDLTDGIAWTELPDQDGPLLAIVDQTDSDETDELGPHWFHLHVRHRRGMDHRLATRWRGGYNPAW